MLIEFLIFLLVTISINFQLEESEAKELYDYAAEKYEAMDMKIIGSPLKYIKNLILLTFLKALNYLAFEVNELVMTSRNS